MFIIENLGNTAKDKEEIKMVHNPMVIILVQFLWPFYSTLLIITGKEDEFPRNQQKSRITIAVIVICVYKKGQHSGLGMRLGKNIDFSVMCLGSNPCSVTYLG